MTSEDLKKLREELHRLREQRVTDAKALERARVRTSGLRTDPSNRNFAASLASDLDKLDNRIAKVEADIRNSEGVGTSI